MADKFNSTQKELIQAEADPAGAPDKVWKGGFGEWLEWVQGHEPKNQEEKSKIKSSIRRGPADPDTFVDRFRKFNEYLGLVERFCREVEDQPKGTVMWEYWFLPAVSTEIGQLRRKLNKMDPTLERDRDPWDTARNQLTDLLFPLWNDLESYHRREHIPNPDADRDLEAIESEDADEFEARVESLKQLFDDISDGDKDRMSLHEILEFITEYQDDTTQSLQGEDLKWATYYLNRPSRENERGHHGLIREAAWGYEMTTRGDIVLNVFREFDGFYGITDLESPDRERKASQIFDILEALFDNPYK